MGVCHSLEKTKTTELEKRGGRVGDFKWRIRMASMPMPMAMAMPMSSVSGGGGGDGDRRHRNKHSRADGAVTESDTNSGTSSCVGLLFSF